MSQPFLSEIRIFAGNFAPRGNAFCAGQIMSIAQNTALFSLLGTNYGGNGQTTFALPDLRSRVPMHWGSGAGLTPHVIGEQSGSESVTLLQTEIPQHTHNVAASSGVATVSEAASDVVLARSADGATAYVASAPNTPLSPLTVGITGSGQPHNNLMPYLAINYIIALQGIFPSRN
jgi:microcystin-dependent protein